MPQESKQRRRINELWERYQHLNLSQKIHKIWSDSKNKNEPERFWQALFTKIFLEDNSFVRLQLGANLSFLTALPLIKLPNIYNQGSKHADFAFIDHHQQLVLIEIKRPQDKLFKFVKSQEELQLTRAFRLAIKQVQGYLDISYADLIKPLNEEVRHEQRFTRLAPKHYLFMSNQKALTNEEIAVMRQFNPAGDIIVKTYDELLGNF